MSKLAGKVAVVTGASKGIGASIAEHLGAAGASVVVNYSSSKASAPEAMRIEVKVAASARRGPRAIRQSSEFAAKPTRAAAVSPAVRHPGASRTCTTA